MSDDVGLGSAVTSRLDSLLAAHPELAGTRPAMVAAAAALVRCWQAGGTVYLGGNGGSHADALHIAGELVKSFEGPRPLPAALREALAAGPHGAELVGALHAGLRTVTLGANGAVASAIANDIALPHVGLAQELVALGSAADVLVAISTSGESPSTVLAAAVARALGMTTVALVGQGRRELEGGELARMADIAIVAPAIATADVQGWHVRLYHCLCGMVETALFGD